MTTVNRRAAGADESAPSALAVARRRWWVIALTVAASIGIAVAGLSMMTPRYQATATLQAPIATGSQPPADLTYADRLMNTYTKVAQQASLRAEVARQLGRPTAPSLAVTVEPNTELLQLSASDPSPATAQRAANIAAGVLVQRVGTLAKTNTGTGEQSITTQLDTLSKEITDLKGQLADTPARNTDKRLRLEQAISGDQANYQALVTSRAQLQLANAVGDQTLTVVQAAAMPTSPASPRWPPVLALALGLGLLGGFGLAFLLERVMPRLYTVEAIETAADADVLAAIPKVTGEMSHKSLYNGGSPAQEAFGVLAVHVLAGAAGEHNRSIVVTSRHKGDGKSTVASNLATELAKSGHNVVVVDADMRSPAMSRTFEVDGSLGLSTILGGVDLAALDEFIVRPDDVPGLAVIPAGPVPDAPARLLASDRFAELVARLSVDFDFIVFDAPPLVVSDPLSIARLSDLVLLVVGGEGVPDRDVQTATRQLSSIGAKRVAVVVNRWSTRDSAYSYSYQSSA